MEELKTIQGFLRALEVKLKNSKDMEIYKELERTKDIINGMMDDILENSLDDEY